MDRFHAFLTVRVRVIPFAGLGIISPVESLRFHKTEDRVQNNSRRTCLLAGEGVLSVIPYLTAIIPYSPHRMLSVIIIHHRHHHQQERKVFQFNFGVFEFAATFQPSEECGHSVQSCQPRDTVRSASNAVLFCPPQRFAAASRKIAPTGKGKLIRNNLWPYLCVLGAAPSTGEQAALFYTVVSSPAGALDKTTTRWMDACAGRNIKFYDYSRHAS